ncbi:hypothetical protein [Acinetobacter sp. YH12099]|uniref:hypothetical protein n=1 Tax=Acinetobacter sp. YH12099 TaxID=2601088 RepID=UPI0015D40462|nr:hypothetical protein [Acinetobacter sp. YH12099]
MKKLGMVKKLSLVLCGCWICFPAQDCTIGSVSESLLQMSSQYRSQTATSFNVRCDRGYSIQFSSHNLRDKHGSSFVNNGTHRLRTSMSIMGAKTNLWNTPIAGHVSTTGHKYSVAVRLDEQPSLTTPAGRYTDELYINLLF